MRLCVLAALIAAVQLGVAGASTSAKPDPFEAELASVPLYLTEAEMPDAVSFLPEPPGWSSPLFLGDHASYLWGKSQRGGAREATAVEQCVFLFDDMLRFYRKAFGMDVSRANTPAIYNVLLRANVTARLASKRPKARYMRTRPYARYGEPTSMPSDEAVLRTNGSYPSGHSIRGWCLALLMTEINPDAQDALLCLGYEWGESRVISGYHWRSDVEAGRHLAAAVVARLHASDEFLVDMAAARAEFARLRQSRARATVITAQPIVNEDVPEPSVCNEIEHVLARAPTDAPPTAIVPLVTNGLNRTQIAIRLVSAQRADGRWLVGTNDVTAAAVELLKGMLEP